MIPARVVELAAQTFDAQDRAAARAVSPYVVSPTFVPQSPAARLGRWWRARNRRLYGK